MLLSYSAASDGRYLTLFGRILHYCGLFPSRTVVFGLTHVVLVVVNLALGVEGDHEGRGALLCLHGGFLGRRGGFFGTVVYGELSRPEGILRSFSGYRLHLLYGPAALNLRDSLFFLDLAGPKTINPGRHGVSLLLKPACVGEPLSEGDEDHGGDGAVCLTGSGGGSQSCDLLEGQLLVHGLEEVIDCRGGDACS
jgi:hypothetical protein